MVVPCLKPTKKKKKKSKRKEKKERITKGGNTPLKASVSKVRSVISLSRII